MLFLKSFFTKKEKSSTVRFAFPLFFGSVALFLASTASSGLSLVKIFAPESAVKVGQAYTVDILVEAAVPVNAIDLEIKFPSELVAVTAVNQKQSVITTWKDQPSIGNGTVRLTGGTFKRGFIGEHFIVTLKVVPKKVGRAEFSISYAELLAGDGTGQSVSINRQAAESRSFLYIYDDKTPEEEVKTALGFYEVTDINNDGRVTLQDISIFLSNWKTRTVFYDFNGDGKMDLRDFSILLTKYTF